MIFSGPKTSYSNGKSTLKKKKERKKLKEYMHSEENIF